MLCTDDVPYTAIIIKDQVENRPSMTQEAKPGPLLGPLSLPRPRTSMARFGGFPAGQPGREEAASSESLWEGLQLRLLREEGRLFRVNLAQDFRRAHSENVDVRKRDREREGESGRTREKQQIERDTNTNPRTKLPLFTPEPGDINAPCAPFDLIACRCLAML